MARELPDPASCTIYPCRAYTPVNGHLELSRVYTKRELLRRDWSMNVTAGEVEIGEMSRKRWNKPQRISNTNRTQLQLNRTLAELENDRQQW